MAGEVLRVRVLDALKASLETMSIATGYHYDMAGKVVWGRIVLGADDPLPIITILEVPIPLDLIVPPPDSSYAKGTWELLIQGFVPDDEERPTRPGHWLMADTKKRLAFEKRRNANFDILGLGANCITDMRIGAGVVRPPGELSDKAFFWLNLSIDMVEDMADPYED